MKHLLFILTAFFFSSISWAVDNIQLAVWANEAIVATYTYDYQNFVPRQAEIAKYFTAEGWINYSTALNAAKLPESVKKNSYSVSAVAVMPPELKSIGQQWQASMPLLVVYKNPQYQQSQTLMVTINFMQAKQGYGIRGYAITNLESKIIKPLCQCQTPEKTTAN